MTDSRRAFIGGALAAAAALLAGCSKTSTNAVTEATGIASGSGGGGSTTQRRSGGSGATTSTRKADRPAGSSPPDSNKRTKGDEAVVAFALGSWGCELRDDKLSLRVDDGSFTLSSGDDTIEGSWALEDGTLRLEASAKSGSNTENFELVLTGVALDATELQMNEYYENGKQQEVSDPKVSVQRDGDSVSVQRKSYVKAKCLKA